MIYSCLGIFKLKFCLVNRLRIYSLEIVSSNEDGDINIMFDNESSFVRCGFYVRFLLFCGGDQDGFVKFKFSFDFRESFVVGIVKFGVGNNSFRFGERFIFVVDEIRFIVDQDLFRVYFNIMFGRYVYNGFFVFVMMFVQLYVVLCNL